MCPRPLAPGGVDIAMDPSSAVVSCVGTAMATLKAAMLKRLRNWDHWERGIEV
jgi:hypothetical protein